MRAGNNWGMKEGERLSFRIRYWSLTPALNLPILGICCPPLLPHFLEPLIFDVFPNKIEPKPGVWVVLTPFATAVKDG